MIEIHIDFVDGTELSYIEGLEKIEEAENKEEVSFTTNCLMFFSNSYKTNVVVIDKHGRSIDKDELMSNKGFNYTDREMRKGHNLVKMLVANALTWKQSESKPESKYDNEFKVKASFKNNVIGVLVTKGRVCVGDVFIYENIRFEVIGMKRFNDDVIEVGTGYECGLELDYPTKQIHWLDKTIGFN